MCISSPTVAASPVPVSSLHCQLMCPLTTFSVLFLLSSRGPYSHKMLKIISVFPLNIGESCFSFVLERRIINKNADTQYSLTPHGICTYLFLWLFIYLLYLLDSLTPSESLIQWSLYTAFPLHHSISLLTCFIFLHSTFIVTLQWSIYLFFY